MINFLKHVVYMAIAVAVLLTAFKIVLSSENVKQAEYRHCLITTFEPHEICNSLKE